MVVNIIRYKSRFHIRRVRKSIKEIVMKRNKPDNYEPINAIAHNLRFHIILAVRSQRERKMNVVSRHSFRKLLVKYSTGYYQMKRKRLCIVKSYHTKEKIINIIRW